jgi:hypothetical protein
MGRIAALLVVTSLASQPACAHHQLAKLTNEQVAFGAVVAAGAVGLVYLMWTQCHQGKCEGPP